MPNKMKNYLAFTIGPIYDTIRQARAVREIWASSFVFSMLMKELLVQLQKHSAVAHILNPNEDLVDFTQKHHGAGVCPDHCQVLLNEDITPKEVQDIIDGALGALKSKGVTFPSDYIHIYAVKGTYNPDDENVTVIFELDKALENCELKSSFRQEGKTNITQDLLGQISDLYDMGFDYKDKTVFIEPPKGQEKGRLPSLIELSTRELSKHSSYKKLMTDKVWENLRKSKGKKEESKDEDENNLLKNLKKAVGEGFRTRHKYYAMVQSDGDGIGALIKSKKNKKDALDPFTKALAEFAKNAAGKIAVYGGVPVYVGGDDLLFIAPLVNHEGKSILQLIKDLSDSFKVGDATLSFGMSVKYYKHPMSDALDVAYDALMHKAKKYVQSDGIKKNTLAFELEKHSGQQIGAILHKNTAAFESFVELCAKYHNLEEAFLSGMMYNLRDQKKLLYSSLKDEYRVQHFFDNNFNEWKHLSNGDFLKDVRDFCVNTYNTASVIDLNKNTSIWKHYLEDNAEVNHENLTMMMIHNSLRFIKFLNAPDHE